jgi:hypothetical protein
MKRGMEVLRSEHLDLPNKCTDILLTSSYAADTSGISAVIAQTDLRTPYVYKRIEQLLYKNIASVQQNANS